MIPIPCNIVCAIASHKICICEMSKFTIKQFCLGICRKKHTCFVFSDARCILSLFEKTVVHYTSEFLSCSYIFFYLP